MQERDVRRLKVSSNALEFWFRDFEPLGSAEQIEKNAIISHAIFLLKNRRDISKEERKEQLTEMGMRLAMRNIGLIPGIIKSVPGMTDVQKEDFDDLCQKGFIHLFVAALKFNPWYEVNNEDVGKIEKAKRFSTYAVKVVYRKLENDLVALLGRDILKRRVVEANVLLVRKAEERLRGLLGEEPSRMEVFGWASLMIDLEFKKEAVEKLTIGDLEELMKGLLSEGDELEHSRIRIPKRGKIIVYNRFRRFERALRLVEMGSLDRRKKIKTLHPETGEYGDFSFSPLEGIKDDCCVEEIAEEGLLKEEIEKILGFLVPVERNILIERYWKERTLEQVAEDFGSSREQISRFEAHALRKLRTDDIRRQLIDYLR